jgi:hypothetical protein
MKSPEHLTGQRVDPPLAAEGGIPGSPPRTGDPYEALDDLMVVIEQLCPRWPPRGTFKADGLWLL